MSVFCWESGLSIDEWMEYVRSVSISERDEAHLVNHFTATGCLPEEWITYAVHPQAEC